MKNEWRRETAGVSTRANGESERTCVEPSSSPERVYGCMGMEGCGVGVRRADQKGMGRSSAMYVEAYVAHTSFWQIHGKWHSLRSHITPW